MERPKIDWNRFSVYGIEHGELDYYMGKLKALESFCDQQEIELEELTEDRDLWKKSEHEADMYGRKLFDENQHLEKQLEEAVEEKKLSDSVIHDQIKRIRDLVTREEEAEEIFLEICDYELISDAEFMYRIESFLNKKEQ